MNSLFPEEPVRRLPAGFQYFPDFLSAEEEGELLPQLAQLGLRNSRYHEYTALRRTASFRLPRASVSSHNPDAPAAPEFLELLALRVAQFVGRSPGLFPHALVTEYPPGAPMGWHRDAPPYSVIYGVSLGSDCRFCLRPQAERLRLPGSTISLSAERRSLYVMAGPARSDWQHSIPAVKALRYSITLRTL